MREFIVANQKGLSLIELMIAVVVGLFLTAGMVQLFTNSSHTYRVQENLSRLQENGRFAMEFLTRDIRMADYSGCARYSLANAVNNLDTAHADYDPVIHGFGEGIDGTNGVAGASIALDAPDSITIRTAEDSGIMVVPPYGPLTSANIKTTTNSGLKEGDIVTVTDCTRADIFQISNANPSGSGTVVHNSGNATSPGNRNPTNCGGGGNAHCLSKVYQGDASIFRLSTLVYTIQNGKAGSLALFRNGDELVEGVENMQILYGEDNTPMDSNFSADSYVPAGTANMANVVSIKINLVLSTLEDSVATQAMPFTVFGDTVTIADRKVRRVFSSTIAVRNRLP